MSAAPQMSDPVTGKTVVLFDGVCVVCNRTVRFLLARDRKDQFRYAPLQSGFAVAAAARHGHEARDINTVCVIADYATPSERLYSKSDAILHFLGEIGGGWQFASLLRVLPKTLRDWAYDSFVRNRYRWFGKYESCRIPTAEERAKFVDVG